MERVTRDDVKRVPVVPRFGADHQS
jgi:hypothetical protein